MDSRLEPKEYDVLNTFKIPKEEKKLIAQKLHSLYPNLSLGECQTRLFHSYYDFDYAVSRIINFDCCVEISRIFRGEFKLSDFQYHIFLSTKDIMDTLFFYYENDLPVYKIMIYAQSLPLMKDYPKYGIYSDIELNNIKKCCKENPEFYSLSIDDSGRFTVHRLKPPKLNEAIPNDIKEDIEKIAKEYILKLKEDHV